MRHFDFPELPQNCDDCPMSYYIQSGDYEGCLMCNGMEFRDRRNPQTAVLRESGVDVTSMYIVDPLEPELPEKCPIA